MATESLEFGRFDNVGDSYTLQLQPITNVTSIVSSSHVISNEIPGQRYFDREFRYKLNGGSFSSWTTVSDIAFQAIAIIATDVIYIEIRYTRVGVVTEGSIRWKQFLFTNITVEPNIRIRFRKTIYDSVYGTQKALDIVEAVTKLSEWSLVNTGYPIYIQNDNSITDQKINIENLTGTSTDLDINVLLKTDLGRRLIKTFFDLDIDINKPKG